MKVAIRAKRISLSVTYRCRGCGEHKPAFDFDLNPRTRKPYARCRSCRRERPGKPEHRDDLRT